MYEHVEAVVLFLGGIITSSAHMHKHGRESDKCAWSASTYMHVHFHLLGAGALEKEGTWREEASSSACARDIARIIFLTAFAPDTRSPRGRTYVRACTPRCKRQISRDLYRESESGKSGASSARKTEWCACDRRGSNIYILIYVWCAKLQPPYARTAAHRAS